MLDLAARVLPADSVSEEAPEAVHHCSGLVVLADELPLFRDALRWVLDERSADLGFQGQGRHPGSPRYEVVEVGNFDDLLDLLEHSASPRLLILDFNLPGARGLLGLVQLHLSFPRLPVAVVASRAEPETVARVLGQGALGFIPKSAGREVFPRALRQLLAGECWVPPELLPGDAEVVQPNPAILQQLASLTPQQRRIAMLVAQGRLNKQIADDLGISENTVKVHVSTLLKRLHLRNRTQVAILIESLHL